MTTEGEGSGPGTLLLEPIPGRPLVLDPFWGPLKKGKNPSSRVGGSVLNLYPFSIGVWSPHVRHPSFPPPDSGVDVLLFPRNPFRQTRPSPRPGSGPRVVGVGALMSGPPLTPSSSVSSAPGLVHYGTRLRSGRP